MIPTVLTIAGTDPTGCAGILADVKTISALGGYALAVPTAIIAQNSQGVQARLIVSPEMITAQLEAVRQAMPVAAIKIGLLPEAGSVEAVVAFLERAGQGRPVVLDPVLSASVGQALADGAVIPFLRERLFSRLSLITPNLAEAAILLDCPVARNRHEMRYQAQALLEQGVSNVLLKGGHLAEDETSPDLLVTGTGHHHWYEAVRIVTPHDRGTGCTLSSAIAFYLCAHGMVDAVSLAKAYLSRSLQTAGQLGFVAVRGPLNHFGWSDQG